MRKLAISGFTPINEIKAAQDTFRLKGDLGRFLGNLERYKLAITLEGDQGAGKTQFAFQLADGFADLGMTIGYYALEIGAKSNIVIKNRETLLRPHSRKQLSVSEVAYLKDVQEKAKVFDVIIIDSWTKLDVDSAEFDKLRNDFPDTIFIVLFQRTSGGKIRGGTKPLYDAGINIMVRKVDNTFVNNYAECTKNRYGQTGLQYNVSQKRLVEQN